MDSGSKLLQDFFEGLISQTFASTIGLRDQNLTGYISEMLTTFCQAEELYKIRDAAGRSLADVGEMLLESDDVTFSGGTCVCNKTGKTITLAQIAGASYRAMKLPAKVLQAEFARGGSFQSVLLRYTHALITQISQTGSPKAAKMFCLNTSSV